MESLGILGCCIGATAMLMLRDYHKRIAKLEHTVIELKKRIDEHTIEQAEALVVEEKV